MSSTNIHEFLIQQGIDPDSIEKLLAEGIAFERLKLEANEIIGIRDHHAQVKLLQAERFLLVMRVSRFT